MNLRQGQHLSVAVLVAALLLTTQVAYGQTTTPTAQVSPITIEGTTSYVSYDAEVWAEDVDTNDQLVHAAFEIRNIVPITAKVTAVVRISRNAGSYVGGCLVSLAAWGSLTTRGTCLVIDAVTDQPLVGELMTPKFLEVTVDVQIDRWYDSYESFTDFGLVTIDSGVTLNNRASGSATCSWYRPWAVVTSNVDSDQSYFTNFLFFDARGTVIGVSGEATARFPGKETVRATAEFNPCFDDALPQPVAVALVQSPFFESGNG